jgi:hypothetical protein
MLKYPVRIPVLLVLPLIAASGLVSPGTRVVAGHLGPARFVARDTALDAGHGSSRRWPLSMCRRQAGARFTTTTIGDQGNMVAEPAAPGARPLLSAAAAYRHFQRAYGPTTRAQDRHTEIRYGLVSDVFEGPESDNVIRYVPETRRARAWVITNCTNASPPTHPGSLRHATVIFAVADTKAVKSWGWAYWPHHDRRQHPGFVGPDGLLHHPRPDSTPFYSAPWRVESHAKNGSVVLRYMTRHCYTLDHVNVFAYHGRYTVSVILSSGPGGHCPKPSATSPFTVIRPTAGPIKSIGHQGTGPRKYRPVDAG